MNLQKHLQGFTKLPYLCLPATPYQLVTSVSAPSPKEARSASSFPAGGSREQQLCIQASTQRQKAKDNFSLRKEKKMGTEGK